MSITKLQVLQTLAAFALNKRLDADSANVLSEIAASNRTTYKITAGFDDINKLSDFDHMSGSRLKLNKYNDIFTLAQKVIMSLKQAQLSEELLSDDQIKEFLNGPECSYLFPKLTGVGAYGLERVYAAEEQLTLMDLINVGSRNINEFLRYLKKNTNQEIEDVYIKHCFSGFNEETPSYKWLKECCKAIPEMRAVLIRLHDEQPRFSQQKLDNLFQLLASEDFSMDILSDPLFEIFKDKDEIKKAEQRVMEAQRKVDVCKERADRELLGDAAVQQERELSEIKSRQPSQGAAAQAPYEPTRVSPLEWSKVDLVEARKKLLETQGAVEEKAVRLVRKVSEQAKNIASSKYAVGLPRRVSNEGFFGGDAAASSSSYSRNGRSSP